MVVENVPYTGSLLFMETPQTKTCKACGQVKSLDSFYRHPTTIDGRLGTCAACHKAYTKERYAKNIEASRAKNRAYYRTRKAAQAMMEEDWIKYRLKLPSCPKVIHMHHALNIPELHITGALMRVWGWVDQNTSDGRMPRGVDYFIDELVEIQGFAKAMESVGWLEITSDGLVFPDFNKHNPKTAKAKEREWHRAWKVVDSIGAAAKEATR